MLKNTSQLIQKRKFGNSNLEVFPMGLGLAALGRPGYMTIGHAEDLSLEYEVSQMQENAFHVLEKARVLGINYFDVARSYGKGEFFLSEWLKQKNQDIIIGSKWGYTYTADWQVQAQIHEVKEHSLAVFQRQIQESQKLLGNNLHIYHIHSATLDSGVLDNTEVLTAMATLKSQGVLVGLSLSSAKQSAILERALKITIDGIRLFDSVQATWNLLEPSVGEILQEAHQSGLGVIIKEPLANGRLTVKNSNSEIKFEHFNQIANDLNTSMDALALAAVLAQPFTTIALSGAANITHLESNLQAFQITWDENLAKELAFLKEKPEKYWQTRSQLIWN